MTEAALDNNARLKLLGAIAEMPEGVDIVKWLYKLLVKSMYTITHYKLQYQHKTNKQHTHQNYFGGTNNTTVCCYYITVSGQLLPLTDNILPLTDNILPLAVLYYPLAVLYYPLADPIYHR